MLSTPSVIFAIVTQPSSHSVSQSAAALVTSGCYHFLLVLVLLRVRVLSLYLSIRSSLITNFISCNYAEWKVCLIAVSVPANEVRLIDGEGGRDTKKVRRMTSIQLVSCWSWLVAIAAKQRESRRRRLRWKWKGGSFPIFLLPQLINPSSDFKAFPFSRHPSFLASCTMHCRASSSAYYPFCWAGRIENSLLVAFRWQLHSQCSRFCQSCSKWLG